MSDVRTTVPSWSLIGSDHSDRRTASSDAHIARHEDHFRHDRHFFIGDPFGYGYHTTGMIIRTTAIMTTILATITMDNPHQPK